PIHIVSARASRNSLVLGQVKTDEKSNEITAVPELLDSLSIEDGIITADAMSCQKDIAAKIIEKGADYILAVKGNQKQLLHNVEEVYRFGKVLAVFEVVEVVKGKIETRICSKISDFQCMADDNNWANLITVVHIQINREFKNRGRHHETITRFYITSIV